MRVSYGIAAAMAFFCLETKEAKIQVKPEGFFARLAFALQTIRTWAGNIYPLLRRALPALQ